MAASLAVGFARGIAGPGASDEHRVKILEGDVTHLYREQQEFVQRLDREAEAGATALQAVQHAGESAHSALRDTVYKNAVGGLDLALVGLIWLACGIGLGAASIETASRMQGTTAELTVPWWQAIGSNKAGRGRVFIASTTRM